jgi:hypothetical protein
MLDFWFALGGAIIEPEFVELVKKTASQVFTKVDRTITETLDTHTKKITCPAAGLLHELPTKTLRTTIRQHLSARMPTPPISIYTAGKLAQLVVVPKSNFGKAIRLAQGAYKAAIKEYSISAPWPWRSLFFPAFFGLCLVDARLTDKRPKDPEFVEALDGFRMTADTQPEMHVFEFLRGHKSPASEERAGLEADIFLEDEHQRALLRSLGVKDLNALSDFKLAQTLLLMGASWTGGCHDQLVFWSSGAGGETIPPGGNERAILP